MKSWRERVVEEAYSWVGTRYHHAADVKGHGVDCAMLLVRIYCDLDLVPRLDPRPYPAQWFLHRDEERYLGWVMQYAKLVEVAQPGDIALFKFGRTVAHGAVIVDDDLMIHAYSKEGVVAVSERRAFEDRLDSLWSL
jgi:cell wall-associated NlpC family hydrolase